MMDSALYQVKYGWIELHSGTRFHFGAPTADMIKVEDVAHSLAHLCRYNGHTTRHYSVAEHCILMAGWVEGNGGGPLECLTALHHDDAEYIIGDLPRPIKARLPQFKELETLLDRAIAERFGTIYPFPPWLKDLDARILVDERSAVMSPSDNEWGTDDLEPLGVEFYTFTGHLQNHMRQVFLNCHERWEKAVIDLDVGLGSS